jgi:hypothetical protein
MHCSMSSGDVPIGMDDRFWWRGSATALK